MPQVIGENRRFDHTPSGNKPPTATVADTMNTIMEKEKRVSRTHTLTLDIAETGLKWQRKYLHGSGKGSGPARTVTHSECWTDHGVYKLKKLRPQVYVVSFTPGLAGELGETIDLGQYIRRTQCDERVAEHIRTGR